MWYDVHILSRMEMTGAWNERGWKNYSGERMTVAKEAEDIASSPSEENGVTPSWICCRKSRSGFAEVIFCARKSDEHLPADFPETLRDGRQSSGTCQPISVRADPGGIPQVEYDPLSHIIKIEKKEKERIGNVAVCTAGTADISVAEEAAQTAGVFWNQCPSDLRCGSQRNPPAAFRLDADPGGQLCCGGGRHGGALASVMGGLVDKPVIAVPTSVGYGASMNGISALLTMINSCANGIAVVNIDNGYGAGYLATQINRLAVHGSEEEENNEQTVIF